MTKLVEIGDEFVPNQGCSTDILRRAAELLGERGWCQGEIEDGDGRMCAVGAIRRAASEVMHTRHSWSESVALNRLRGQVRTREMHSIPRWNDAPERTAEDVILAMKRAAEDD
jgi:hypothetical protein